MDAVPASLERNFHDLNATRYMSAAGLIILLYDHLLTFGDEVQYIWSAPATYAKYIFLLNRYTVLGILIAVAYEMCGFVGVAFTDAIILKIMAGGFVISFTAQVTSMIYTLITLLPSISWNSAAGMCILTKSSPILIAVWACPMIFELFVLCSTALNALDRPRTMDLRFHKALQEDGIQFFVSISTFRILNIIFAALDRPSLTFLAVFFIWAMTTTILGRLLLHLRRTECLPPSALTFDPALASFHSNSDIEMEEEDGWDPRRRSRAISPFGLIPLSSKRMSGGSSVHSSEADLPAAARMDSYDDVLHIAPPAYHYRKRSHDPNLRPWD
ncbi:hypothetical protein GSI_03562 [Ganoderma sinense ZZ0214-1]|uniref:DUF6533 domain-containing protein n=1 Tax=Ganoderma sinense ZZ0214-1 TaxID=1077348 RepID=A0A2G8SJA1_9APHY|nr:hypothetical protein GSI_03562 [Ganoderma sinense ZZ0214-1]